MSNHIEDRSKPPSGFVVMVAREVDFYWVATLDGDEVWSDLYARPEGAIADAWREHDARACMEVK